MRIRARRQREDDGNVEKNKSSNGDFSSSASPLPSLRVFAEMSLSTSPQSSSSSSSSLLDRRRREGSDDATGTATLAGIPLPSLLEPAMKQVRKSSDDLLALVKAEREKVTQSLRSAAAAAAASPFAPVSLEDFGGDAWREFKGWSAVAVGLGNGSRRGTHGVAETTTTTTTKNGRWRNRRTSAASSSSSSSSSSSARQQQPPPQFGMDVFSALNDSLRTSSRGSGSASRIKSKVRNVFFVFLNSCRC